MNEEKSTAYQFIEFVWKKNQLDSYLRINQIMYNAVKFAIDAKFNFNENDITEVFKNFKGGYWFGFTDNVNGGYGAFIYSHAGKSQNINACVSIEKFMGINPFILVGKRVHRQLTFINSETKRYYRVTGFDIDNKVIRLMSWENGKEEGKYKLHSFTNKEWNTFRKDIINPF